MLYTFLFLAENAIGQSFIVTNQGDTIRGDVEIISAKNFDEVAIKSMQGKQQLKVYQLSHVQIGEEGFKPIIYNDRQQLAKIRVGGKLNYYLVREAAGYEFAVKLLQKETGEQLLVPNLLRFRKQVSAFISECETLSELVADGTYKQSDLDKIVTLYNDGCKTEAALLQLDLEGLSLLIQEVSDLRRQGKPVPKEKKELLEQYLQADIRAMLEELQEEID